VLGVGDEELHRLGEGRQLGPFRPGSPAAVGAAHEEAEAPAEVGFEQESGNRLCWNQTM
jgi:hypothetical protein